MTSLVAMAALLVLMFSRAGATQSQEAEELLHKRIDAAINDTRVRPRSPDWSGVTIHIGVQFVKIVELDVVKGKFAMTANMFGMWKDPRAGWNFQDYDGHVCIERPRKRHWYPKFQLFSSIEQNLFFPGDDLFVCSPPPPIAAQWNAGPGTFFFDLFHKFEILCDFDVYKFPFDTQVCTYLFSPYLMDNTSTRLIDFNVDPMITYKENKEWIIDNITKDFRNETMILASRPVNCSVMEFKVYLRRRSLSYIGTIFVPTMALGVLTLMIHVIPPESGEKISLGISVFLAFSVFQLMLVDSLPQSDTLPLVAMLVISTQVVSASSIIVSSYILKVFYRTDNHNIPSWLRKMLTSNIPMNTVQPFDEKNEAITWRDVARAYDKLGLIVISLGLFVPGGVMLIFLVT